MINIINLQVNFGAKTVFENASGFIAKDGKTGLIGRNGSGKTTLLHLLKGQASTHFGGEINFSGKPKIGYLPQEMEIDSSEAVINFSKRAMIKILDLEKSITVTEAMLEKMDVKSSEYQSLIEKLGSFHDQFKHMGGYQSTAMAGKILAGLGFLESDMKKALSTFSGGWQIRAYLAQILLGDYEILLLDEPTNHLDLESVIWLENFLRNIQKTIVIVSHDYSFLDRVVNQTLAIENKKLISFPGNISAYEEKREQDWQHLERVSIKRKKEIESIEKFVNRFRYKATKARQAQSRLKKLEKLKAEKTPVKELQSFEFNFPTPPPCSKELMSFDNVSFSYESQTNLLKDIDLKFFRNEKYALIGKNGSGKSTFVKLIAGILKPVSGNIQLNNQTTIGYFAQHTIENLNIDLTIYKEIEQNAAASYQGKIRDILGLFMFSGEEQFKKIKYLSGGEKARVAIAKLFVSPVNFLVLDEPTNHLDIASKQVLIEAINHFSGSVIVISHDTDLLEQTIEKVLYIESGTLKNYEGDYHLFQEFIRKRISKNLPENIVKKEKTISSNQERRSIKKDFDRQLRKMVKELDSLEANIDNLEKQKTGSLKLQQTEEYYLDRKKADNLRDQISKTEKELESLYHAWESVQTEIEDIKGKLKEFTAQP